MIFEKKLNSEKIKFYVGDVRDKDSIEKAVKESTLYFMLQH